MIKVLGRFCIGSGLFLFGLVKIWLPAVLILSGIAFLFFYEDFHID